MNNTYNLYFHKLFADVSVFAIYFNKSILLKSNATPTPYELAATKKLSIKAS